MKKANCHRSLVLLFFCLKDDEQVLGSTNFSLLKMVKGKDGFQLKHWNICGENCSKYHHFQSAKAGVHGTF